jgi:hypothetical protein
LIFFFSWVRGVPLVILSPFMLDLC